MKFVLVILLSVSMLQTTARGAEIQAASSVEVDHQRIRDAVEKSLLLLERASAGSAEKRPCFTCHSQALPVLAITAARDQGFRIDKANLRRQLDHTAEFLGRGKENYVAGKGQGGRIDTAGYALWTLQAGKHKPDTVTAAVAEYILQTNVDSGHWAHSSNRPPTEASDFTTTYVALRGLAAFGIADQKSRISERQEAALQWLLKSKTVDTEDRVFQLRALFVAQAEKSTQRAFADKLIATQRSDGGWAQKDDMNSDAYATGTVLSSLAQTGHVLTTSPVYQNGLRFLLKSQKVDGSWLVESRSKPFQKYFETGFPHGAHQFVSTSATAWATIALLETLSKSDSK
jgi:N-acyl-D-amino-acid deacylase